MHPDGRQRVVRLAPLVHVPRAIENRPHAGGRPLLKPVVGAEQTGGHPGGEQGGRRVGTRREHQHERVGAVTGAHHLAHAISDKAARDRRQGATGGADGVGHHQLVGGYDVGQARAEPGQEEPVDRQCRQNRHDQHRADDTGRDHRCDGQHDQRAHRIGYEQHLTAAPAVQDHPGERADQGVGQHGHRERTGRSAGRGGSLG